MLRSKCRVRAEEREFALRTVYRGGRQRSSLMRNKISCIRAFLAKTLSHQIAFNFSDSSDDSFIFIVTIVTIVTIVIGEEWGLENRFVNLSE